MTVYDFDGTVYDGDSTIDFYKHCLKYYPRTRRAIWIALCGLFLYMFGIIDKTRFKERFFSFLRYVPNVDEAVTAFWNTYEKKLKPWYLIQKHNTDVIISASPEFLLAPICRKLGVTLIGSQIDKQTGRFNGENCHDREKVNRLMAEFIITECSAFYSDSLTDKPLADLIPNSFIVRSGKFIPWDEYKPSVLSQARQMFITPDFIVFVFCGGCGTIVNFCFSLLLAQRFDFTFAYVGGYAVSLLVTYVLNTVLIFKEKLSIQQFVKFAISYIPNFLILFMFVAIFLNVFHLWEVIVYASAALFGLPITFILVKLFAFKSKKSEEEN